MTDSRNPFRPISVLVAMLLMVPVSAAAVGSAQGPWNEKRVDQMDQDELVELLNDSPWARTVDLWQLTGRRLAELANGQVAIYQDSPTSPPYSYSIPTRSTRPERMQAAYVVRWGTADIVIQALERLREISSPLADMQAPPEELVPDHFIITVRTAKPPTPSAADRLSRAQVFDQGRPLGQETFEPRDLFFAKESDELVAAAELRTSAKQTVKPEQVVRHGVGAGEGISFVFPLEVDGKPLLASNMKWFEFRFKDDLGNTLKARFEVRKMTVSGELDT